LDARERQEQKTRIPTLSHSHVAISSQLHITILLILHLIDNLLLLTTKKQQHTMLMTLLLRERDRGRSRRTRQRSLQRSDGKSLLADGQGAEERATWEWALTEQAMLPSGGRGGGGSSTVDDSEGVAIGRGTGTSRGRGGGGGEGTAVVEHRAVEVGVGSVDVLRVGHCEITRQHTVAVLYLVGYGDAWVEKDVKIGVMIDERTPYAQRCWYTAIKRHTEFEKSDHVQ
jgi:hypothetical protein